MKVLVTGATGFIGRYLVNSLQRQGIEYVTLGKNSLNSGQHIQFDLLSDEDLIGQIKKIGPTHLVHLAWYTEHGEYWESPLNISWLMATSRLIEAFCQSDGRHVVIAGTCAEYDWRNGYCVEDLTPLVPKTLYGISKNSTRSLAYHMCNKYSVGLAWARIFFPYGLGEQSNRLIPSLFGVFRGDRRAFGVNALAYRDLLHVSDVANAILICSQKQVQGDINICSGEPTSMADIVGLIASIFKKSPDIILSRESSRLGEPKILIGQNEKLKRLGWSQEIMIEDGINLCK